MTVVVLVRMFPSTLVGIVRVLIREHLLRLVSMMTERFRFRSLRDTESVKNECSIYEHNVMCHWPLFSGLIACVASLLSHHQFGWHVRTLSSPLFMRLLWRCHMVINVGFISRHLRGLNYWYVIYIHDQRWLFEFGFLFMVYPLVEWTY